MKKILEYTAIILVTLISVHLYIQNEDQVIVYLIGDSTMADKPLADNPERGWGQMFPMFFNDNVIIENHARNGRSTKSFIDEGRWKTVFDKLQQGNYVFIQFAHNDEKEKDSTRYAAPHTTFKNNLIKFVKESREKGAIPVLITPVNRRKFDEHKNLIDTHKDYPAVVREIAQQENTTLIDLTKKSEVLFNKLGREGTKKIFLWVPPNKYKALPEGKEDNTHFNQNGATQIAKLVVDGIKESDLILKKYIKENPETALGNGKLVGLDYYFNNEWKDI